VFRFRRHCYDKPWRCPGWAGGGWRSPRRGDACDDGSLSRYWNPTRRWYTHWQFHRCLTCGTIAIPHVTRWLDWTWLGYKIKWWYRELRYRWEMR